MGEEGEKYDNLVKRNNRHGETIKGTVPKAWCTSIWC